MQASNIAIIGLGVMGGSLLLASKKIFPNIQVSVITRNQASQDWAKEKGACFVSDKVTDLVGDFDFIFMATPSFTLEQVSKDLLPNHKKSLITDLASAKGVISSTLGHVLSDHKYLSCHPMCGSEKTGIDGAKIDLYENKTVVITPHSKKSENHINDLSEFWKKLNCRLTIMDPHEHDNCVAWVSHMPHLLMSSLVHSLDQAKKENSRVFETAGTGLRDITRLAASNPELWQGIVLENLPAIKDALKGLQKELHQLDNLLNQPTEKLSPSLFDYLNQAQKIHKENHLNKI